MTKKMRSLKNKAAIMLAALLLAASFSGLVFAEPASEGEVTGVFSLQVVPEVVSFTLHQVTAENIDDAETLGDGEQVVAGSPLTPLHWYDVKVEVKNEDNIADLGIVQVVLWHHVYQNKASRKFHQTTNTFSGNTNTTGPLVFQWEKQSGFVEFVGPHIQTKAWGLFEQNQVPEGDDLEGDTFEFIFRFQVSKVAESGNNHDHGKEHWYLSVAVTNSGTPEHWDDYGRYENATGEDYYHTWGWDSIGALRMNWYGEVQVPLFDQQEDYTVEWSGVSPGIQFTDERAEVQLTESIRYIANGHYYRTIKAGETWTAAGETSAQLTTGDDFTDPQVFGLMARIDSEDEKKRVAHDEHRNIGDKYMGLFAGTTYNGDLEKPFLYLQLSDDFMVDTYTGSINFGIANYHAAEE